jgi:SH3-like domain-containing protein
MRKKTASLALLVLFLFPWVAEAKFISINHKDAKVRLGPGTQYNIRWKPILYTPLEVLCKYESWYVVRDHEGDVGWVHESVVSEEPTLIVVKQEANLRSGPSTEEAKLFTVEKGYTFRVLKKQGQWYQVKDAEGDTGWIFEDLVWGGGK